jgi:spore maturation protein CgeB
LRILIRNPAPSDPLEHRFWGDAHFGESLAAALRKLGHEVHSQLWPDWDEAESDLLIVLRGLRKSENIVGDFGTTAVWIISHPEEVSNEELALFDLVFCGSARHAKQLTEEGFQAHVLLQCTDERIFYSEKRDPAKLENAFVFVGNWRGGNRNLIGRALDAQIPLKIWGRRWDRPFHAKSVVADHYPNAKLGNLYRKSYATLNDHWKDMIEFEYVNNRIFDALACALPLLTEDNRGLAPLGFKGLKAVEDSHNFQHALDEFILNYDFYQKAAYQDAANILENHTFNARAREILRIVDEESP